MGTGIMTRPMVKEHLNILMEIFMMENGKMGCLMGLECIRIPVAHFMKVCLKMNRKMDKAFKNGRMDHGMMVNLKMEKSMVMETIK